MSVALLTAQQLPGLFELDARGKVLYHRMDSFDTPPDMTGHNFYDEVASFDNVAEFRQCVTDFTEGAKPADSFDFDCHYSGSDHPVRVLLARICERLDRNTRNPSSCTSDEESGNTRGERDDERDVNQ